MSYANARNEPTQAHQSPSHENEKGPEPKRLHCSIYGCRRVYTDTDSLSNHVQDHHIHSQSLPGKTFHCSSPGCNGSFSSMQDLMKHTRNHHKPNIYFQCESCRSKLRTYPALLKHLHTCSKVAKGKIGKTAEQSSHDQLLGPNTPSDILPSPNPNPSTSPMDTDSSNAHQQRESGTAPHLLPSQLQLPKKCSLLAPSSTCFPRADSQLQAQSQSQPQTQSQVQDQTPNTDNPEQPEDQAPPQMQQQAEPSVQDLPALTSSSQTSPGSNAVWRKNQGTSFNSRIVWEHSRGRYTCVQCGQSSESRQEMTAHIEINHKSPSLYTQ
ncbi:zinc finger protein 414 [Osmerus eperlanus]|uniref:zinc finger protein 414 n=1 Tax=Osmerus eperlanus TaxID=29151 RepID=UPI002E13DEBD